MLLGDTAKGKVELQNIPRTQGFKFACGTQRFIFLLISGCFNFMKDELHSSLQRRGAVLGQPGKESSLHFTVAMNSGETVHLVHFMSSLEDRWLLHLCLKGLAQECCDSL